MKSKVLAYSFPWFDAPKLGRYTCICSILIVFYSFDRCVVTATKISMLWEINREIRVIF